MTVQFHMRLPTDHKRINDTDEYQRHSQVSMKIFGQSIRIDPNVIKFIVCPSLECLNDDNALSDKAKIDRALQDNTLRVQAVMKYP